MKFSGDIRPLLESLGSTQFLWS